MVNFQEISAAYNLISSNSIHGTRKQIFKKISYWRLSLKVVKQIQFSAILTLNKGQFTYGHKCTFP